MDYENIKFRAWHKNKGRMYNVLELDFSSNIVRLDYYFVTTHSGTVQEIPFWEPVYEVELMIYTGQQDKHGKDIYEGDIVSYTEVEGYSWEAWQNTKQLVTEVTASIKTEFEEYCGVEDTEISYENLEIIGNKYENPELL